MGIFDRLGTVINSHFSDFAERTNRGFKSSGDPDFDAAYEELNDFLNNKESRFEKKQSEYTSSSKETKTTSDAKLPPEELRDDFEKLGVPFGADEKTCKAAYKKLMKIHHPDRHAGHENNLKKATEKSAQINASWDRINKWHQAGKKG